jgi:hypothetical protein
MLFNGLQRIPGQIVHDSFFFFLFFPGGIKVNFAVAKTQDMNQFMHGNVKHQRAELDERISPIHRIKNDIVLQADSVKIKPVFAAFRESV